MPNLAKPEAHDDQPDIDTKTFDGVEKQMKTIIKSAVQLKKHWRNIDYNGNGKCSLAEIDKWVLDNYPILRNKPAIMRAYKKTTLRDGDGDAWVEKNEFPALLRNIVYFNRAYEAFEDIDTSDDRRVDIAEFKAGTAEVGMSLSDEEAEAEFKKMDKNGGGQVLFDEFCVWLAEKQCPVDGEVVTEFTTSDDRPSSGTKAARAAPAVRPHDDQPDIDSDTFDVVEKKIKAIMASAAELKKNWSKIDYNGNGKCSLAEIDKWVLDNYPILRNKPAIMRAYKKTTLRDGDGDAWVEKNEFPALLRNIVYFNRAYEAFDGIDSGDDRRMDLAEFKAGMGKVGLSLTEEEAAVEFKKMDKNGGGKVLFDEFCVWLAEKQCPVDGEVFTEHA